MREWQPIETAPKDGTRILVIGGTYSSDGGEAGVMYDTKTPLVEADTARWVDGAWWMGYGEAYREEYWGEPTHWMPLPEPPNAKNKEPETFEPHEGGGFIDLGGFF